MDPIALILLLVAAAVVLLVAELLLPTHGVLGFVGLLCLAGVIVVCFRLNPWAGLIVFAAMLLSSPFLFNLSLKIWAKSPVGRMIILQPVQTPLAPSPVKLGQIGTAVTEMRPMGECDFGDHRLEAISELDIIRAGQKVKVIAIDNGRPTVRAVETTVAANAATLSSEKETS